MKTLAAFLLAAILVFPSANPTLAAGADAAFAEGLRAYDAGDYTGAFNRWRPLAESGDAEAETALAELYFQGLGVRRDAAEAARWYRRAAERGHGVAQMNLGDMLARGQGIKRDPVRAYFWLELAARQGKAWAARRRDELANTMTASARAQALKLIKARPPR
ncbi:MAG: tetratricopeptide repeat protein [Alphaproteobacteria bacterium]